MGQVLMTKIKVLVYDSWPNLFDTLHLIFSSYENIECFYLCNEKLFKKYSNQFLKDRLGDSNIAYEDFEKYDYDPIKVCQELNIDIVLFVSIHNPEQRYFNYCVRSKGIKTVLLMHGVISKNEIIGKNKNKIFNKIVRFPYIFYFIWKLFTKVSISKKLFVIKECIDLLLSPNNYKNKPILKDSVQIDYLFYCNETDVEFYKKYIGTETFYHKKINSLDYLLYESNNIIQKHDIRRKVKKNRAVFFTQPIHELGTEVIKYVNILNDLKSELNAIDIELFIKEHPRQDYRITTHNSFIGVIENRAVHEIVDYYQLFITINSTALMLPAMVGRVSIGLARIFGVEQLNNERIENILSLNEIKNIDFNKYSSNEKGLDFNLGQILSNYNDW